MFCHSSYGWDLAPRVACALEAAQVSEVMDLRGGLPVAPACNGKLRRTVQAKIDDHRSHPAGRGLWPCRRADGQPRVQQVDSEASGAP